MPRFTIAISPEQHVALRKTVKRWGSTNNQIVGLAIAYFCANQDEPEIRDELMKIVKNRDVDRLAAQVTALSEDDRRLLAERIAEQKNSQG